MVAVKLPDDHPVKCREAGLTIDARTLHIDGLCHTMRRETAGRIAESDLAEIAGGYDPWTGLAGLIRAGWWAALPDGGWLIVQDMDKQETLNQIGSRRAAGRARVARHRDKQRNAVTSGAGNAVTESGMAGQNDACNGVTSSNGVTCNGVTELDAAGQTRPSGNGVTGNAVTPSGNGVTPCREPEHAGHRPSGRHNGHGNAVTAGNGVTPLFEDETPGQDAAEAAGNGVTSVSTHINTEVLSTTGSTKNSKVHSRGTRIPGDFTPTVRMIAWATENCPHVSRSSTTEQFIDYWKSQSGQRATKPDWEAAWRYWMRKAEDDAVRQGVRRGGYNPSMRGGARQDLMPAVEIDQLPEARIV